MLDIADTHHQVQVEQNGKVLLLLGSGGVATVKPANEQAERLIFLVGQTILAVLVLLALEDVSEELAAVAQKLLVQNPVGVLLTDIDVDHVTRQQPITTVSILASSKLNFTSRERTREEAYLVALPL